MTRTTETQPPHGIEPEVEDPVEDLYPLAPLQQGMLFTSRYTRQKGAYVEQRLCRLRGEFNPDAFEDAWRTVTGRHPSLRTAFVWEDLDEPLQVVYRMVTLARRREDWRDRDHARRDADLERFLTEDRAEGFDLSEPPLFRLTLFRLEDDLWQFVWTYHHLLLDGWSAPLLIEEVIAFYQGRLLGNPPDLAKPRPYRDYIAWLSTRDPAATEPFWRESLRGFRAPTPIGTLRGFQAGTHQSGGHAAFRFRLTEPETRALTEWARANQWTLNTVFQGMWGILLGRFCAERDLVFGAVVSGRPPELEGVASMVGLFINTLPVRVRLDPGLRVHDFLDRVQRDQVAQRPFEHTPLVRIQGWSEVPRGTPLFECILVFENYPIDLGKAPATDGADAIKPAFEAGDMRFEEETTYPLSLVVNPGKALPLKLNYDRNRFHRTDIRRIAMHLQRLASEIRSDPDLYLADLETLCPWERAQILVEWNDSGRTGGETQSFHQRFSAWSRRNPDSAALAFADRVLSYGVLDRAANRLAQYLRHLGVGPEIGVGLCFERGTEPVRALLAVLKAGGYFVPLDPDLPTDRLGTYIEEAGPALILTHEAAAGTLPAGLVPEIPVDREASEIEACADTDPGSATLPDQAAYLIFTSGSTGRPKGVLLIHRGLANLVAAQARSFGVGPGHRVLRFASPSFDASVFEAVMALGSGAVLVLAARETLMPGPGLNRFLRARYLNNLTLPPSVLATLPTGDVSREGPPLGATIVSAGEALTGETAACHANRHRLFNAYGPTETTIWATVAACAAETREPSIGRPIANFRITLLDRGYWPVPIGVAGQLHIAGPGLARGYLGLPSHTAAAFRPDPFHGSPGCRLYRSGDLARFRPDGRIDFLGRTDTQVKIRGYRIETGEIEAALARFAEVAEAAVIARDDGPGGIRLVAYVAPNDPGQVEPQRLRRALGRVLPEYMVPSGWLVLDRLPRTAANKVDRRALPDPESAAGQSERPHVPPRTPLEIDLARIWERVLDLERIGIHDNFFELGGHSLLATQIISKVWERFKVELPIGAIFDRPTVSGLAEAIQQGQITGEDPDEMEALLREMETMTEEEADLLLAAEAGPESEGGGAP